MPHKKLLSHETYMAQLVVHARKNPKAPFAAMIVDNTTGEILSMGLNASSHDPTKHGEIDAINKYAYAHPKRDFSQTILYTTAEPCPMCMAAVIWARIPSVVYGTSIPKLIRYGWRQINIRSEEMMERSKPMYRGQLISDVLCSETDALFQKKTPKA